MSDRHQVCFRGNWRDVRTGTDTTGREIERACAGNFLDGSDAFCIALQRIIKMADGYGVNDYRDALTPISTR